jgi:uncharacterized membrane protein YqjE
MSAASAGLMGSLRQLGVSLVSIFSTRLALLANELQEESLRLTQLLLYALLALFCFAFGLLFLIFFVVLLYWDSHRLLVLGLTSSFFFVLTGLLAWLLTVKARTGSKLFAASLAELEHDAQLLRGQHE